MDLFSNLFGAPVPAVTAQELNEKLKNGKRPLVIDVREPEEYREGHSTSAKLIPLGQLNLCLKEQPKEQEIVRVCASDSRNSAAIKQLIKAGYTAINMNGGMVTWMRAGLPVKKGSA